MSHYALLFLVIAIVAEALGFGGVAGAAVVIAKILFLVLLILFVLWLLIERRRACQRIRARSGRQESSAS